MVKQPQSLVSDADVKKVLDVCAQDQRMSGFRDAAIISLLYNTGLSQIDIVSLNVEHVQQGGKQLRFQSRKRIRTVTLPTATRKLLNAWLQRRGSLPGALFGPFTPSGDELSIDAGSQQVRHLRFDTIADIVERRSKEAHVQRFTPRDLRRAFAARIGES